MQTMFALNSEFTEHGQLRFPPRNRLRLHLEATLELLRKQSEHGIARTVLPS